MIMEYVCVVCSLKNDTFINTFEQRFITLETFIHIKCLFKINAEC